MTISSLAKQTGRQLVMVILAVLLTLFTYPALHSLHSIIIEPIYRIFLAESVVPATVSVQPKLKTQGEWHISSASFSSAISESFYSSSSHSPIFGSLWYELAVPFRSVNTPIAYQFGTERWQPAQHNYKRLLSYYSDQILFDALVQLNDKPKQQGLDAVVLTLKPIPIDLFGGGYLLHDLMPEPALVYLATDADYIVDHWSPVTEQFIRELSALEADYWVVTPLWLLAVSALLVLVPWWLPSKTASVHWLDAALALAMMAGAVLLVVMYHWWLPLLVPLLSVVVAALFRIHVRRLARRTSLYSNAYAGMGERWVHHLLDEAKPEMALRFLMECQPPLLQPQLWLDTGQGFERNRELTKAQHCYQSALQVDEDCTEARSRLRRLNKIVDGGKTMAIAQVRGELPVGQIDDLTLGRYRLQRELGRGAMGIVYEAIDPKIDRKLALKVVHLRSLGLDEVEQVKQRFFREAQAAGKLNHPHIVTVYDVGEEHDVAYIAMDLLHGFSLAQQIQKGTTIDIVERVTWIAQAAEALAYAHDHDVIHRDVKPANMIIDERNHNLKLTDFGVARIAGVQQTQTGIVLGSPSYMSPEQIRGEPLTGQTDIFSLGVTLFQAITGVLPFTGDTLPALAYSITQSKQASPRAINEQVPVSLVRIVNRALQKSTLERYQTGQEFAQALRKWLADHNK